MLVNRVEQSGLITLDLAELLPNEADILSFDLKDHLVQGMVLMEKPFRAALKETDWSAFKDVPVAVYCSADALIPKWAYMLVGTYLSQVTPSIYFGNKESVLDQMLLQSIRNLDVNSFVDARVVVKGCGDQEVSAEAYMAITQKLVPVAKSIMYGEPCSTVPVFKRPKNI